MNLLRVLKLWTHRESNDIVLGVPVGSIVTIAEFAVAKLVKRAKCCAHCMAVQVPKLAENISRDMAAMHVATPTVGRREALVHSTAEAGLTTWTRA